MYLHAFLCPPLPPPRGRLGPRAPQERACFARPDRRTPAAGLPATGREERAAAARWGDDQRAVAAASALAPARRKVRGAR